MTFWDHLGTSEWAQLTYASAITTGAVSVYWFDDTGTGQCRIPQSWQVQYRNAGGAWVPVSGASAAGTATNTFNRVTFTAVTTTALRVAVQLKAGVSGGILELRVEGTTTPVAWKRIQNKNSLKVLGVDGMSTANSANVVQYDDNGTADHNWRLVDAGGGWYKILNQNSGKMLAVQNMSTANARWSSSSRTTAPRTTCGGCRQRRRLVPHPGPAQHEGARRLRHVDGELRAGSCSSTTPAPPTTCGGSSRKTGPGQEPRGGQGGGRQRLLPARHRAEPGRPGLPLVARRHDLLVGARDEVPPHDQILLEGYPADQEQPSRSLRNAGTSGPRGCAAASRAARPPPTRASRP